MKTTHKATWESECVLPHNYGNHVNKMSHDQRDHQAQIHTNPSSLKGRVNTIGALSPTSHSPPPDPEQQPHFQIKFISNWEHPTRTELFRRLLSGSLGDVTRYLATEESGSSPGPSVVPQAASATSSMGKLNKQRLFAVR